MNNETPNLYSEGSTLSHFIHEGRPTTTKLTYVALPSSISHSTFHECLRGTPCQPQASLHKHLTKLVMITSYSLHLERRITSLSTSTTRWNTTTEFTQKKSIYSNSSSQRPPKLVSTLPPSLPNRRESYLHRIPCLRRHNLHQLIT